MKLIKHLQNLTVELEADTASDAFEALASTEEVFGNNNCGACGAEARFVVRTNDSGDFYEMKCENTKCRARLSFGKHKKGGGLFPKRKDGDKWLENNGWVIYKPDSAKSDSTKSSSPVENKKSSTKTSNKSDVDF